MDDFCHYKGEKETGRSFLFLGWYFSPLAYTLFALDAIFYFLFLISYLNVSYMRTNYTQYRIYISRTQPYYVQYTIYTPI